MRTLGYRWHLRTVMAKRGIFATTKLVPLLAERGVQLSTAQVYRLVTGTPERINLHVLAALADALDCTVDDLFEVYVTGEDGPSSGPEGGHDSPA